MEEQRNQFLPYKIICEPGYGEYEEKKSRFLANAAPVTSEEEAAAFIASIRKKYYDARHHCYAFVIGRNREITRCSDDGEPGGTAGKPILETLLGTQAVDGIVVVTRYFGGTLLGAGGLVRSYTRAAQEGLANAKTAVMRYGTELTVNIGYADVGAVQYLLETQKTTISASRYTDRVEFDIRIPTEQEKKVRDALTEATAGRAGISLRGCGYYMDTGNFV